MPDVKADPAGSVIAGVCLKQKERPEGRSRTKTCEYNQDQDLPVVVMPSGRPTGPSTSLFTILMGIFSHRYCM